jgi:two-component system chemotaxis sensor kinase CheA
MDEFEIEIKKDFLNEAKDLLDSTEQSFLTLERDPDNKSLVEAIFRFAHNLKGSSRAVGFGQIAELTHVAENLVLCLKDGRLAVTSQIVSILLDFNDKAREMIEGLQEDMDATFEYSALLTSIEAAISGKTVAVAEVVEEVVEAAPVETAPSAEAFAEEEDPMEIIRRFNEEAEADYKAAMAEEQKSQEAQVIPMAKAEPVAAAPVAQKEAKKEVKKDSKKDDETLRVSLSRLEKLNDLIGEMVILQAVVESSLAKYGEHKTARSLGKLCKDIQDLSMSMRMVPMQPTFQKLSRIVRDTSKLLNKQVDLQLIGEETEIDKTVLESLGDPLVHIIRNAIDHGVESPEERVMNNKAEAGVVEVMAFHEGNNLVIQITDDGKGINPAKLIEKAKSKGIIPPNAQLTEQQGIELIFHPGFSTKDEVSEVSGRGVGMDVVKTNIEALGGEVKVRSRVGAGSCFRIMLPLTLAIIDGMLIDCGEQSLVVPKSQVQEVIRIEEKQVTKMTGRRPYLTIRDEIIPLYMLEEDLLNKKNDARVAVIVRQGDSVFAVGMTDIKRQQQIVVKPPTKEIAEKTGIMGTTILGDGRPALILDLINMYAKQSRKEAKTEKRVAA